MYIREEHQSSLLIFHAWSEERQKAPHTKEGFDEIVNLVREMKKKLKTEKCVVYEATGVIVKSFYSSIPIII